MSRRNIRLSITVLEFFACIFLSVYLLLTNVTHATTNGTEPYYQAVDKRVKTIITNRGEFKWVTVTGYCDCPICCGKWSGTKKMKVGQIAASRSIPFGTRIRINGKVYVVNDRLAKKYDKRMDVYFRSHAEAKKFGKKRLKVEILN